jgi:hypothetical protein
MRCVFLSLVMGCGLFLGCAGQGVATAVATEKAPRPGRPERPERPKYPAERVLIVLDASASMGQQGADAMLQATQALLDSLSLADTFGLAMTSRGQVVLYKPSYESVTNETVDDALKWAARQPVGGGTDLAGAIQAALSLRGENVGRADLVLLTDGQNNVNPDQRLVKPKQMKGLTVWLVNPTLFQDPGIHELCQITEGRVFRLASDKHAGRIAEMRSSIESRRKLPKKASGWSDLGRFRYHSGRGTVAEEARRTKRVEEKLRQRLTVRLIEQEFPAVMEYLREVASVSIYVDWGALENDNPDICTAQVTVQLKDVTVQKALEVILAEAGGGLMELGYRIEGGVILIDTSERLNERVVTRVYPVRDLLSRQSSQPVVRLPREMKCFCEGCPVTLRFARTWGDVPACPVNPVLRGQKELPLGMELSNLIKQHVAHESWYPNGTATLAVFDGVLIVSQTPENQGAIGDLLERIRYGRNLAIPEDTYRSVESIYDRPGQLAPWTQQLLQAVADGTLSPHSTLVRIKRNGVESVIIDGTELPIGAGASVTKKTHSKPRRAE